VYQQRHPVTGEKLGRSRGSYLRFADHLARLQAVEPHAMAERLIELEREVTRSICALNWSGWPDSNRRPPAPKAGALTKLRHIPQDRSVAYRPARPPPPLPVLARGLPRLLLAD
jgi:hypothetical protein